MSVTTVEKLEAPEIKVDELDKKVESSNSLVEKRSKIHALLDNFEDKKIATNKTVQEYRKAVDADKTLEGLQGFHQWIAQEWMKANFKLNRLQSDINEGIKEGIMSDGDRAFLMEKLILTDEHDFVGQADKIENILKKKIDNMKKDREQYDKLANHTLVKNTGFLKTDKDTKINIPNETDFLKMKVPDRRQMLEKAKEALPKAEKYAEQIGGVESEKFTKEYSDLLKKAQGAKLIGKKTVAKYMDGFKKIDLKEKEYWLAEMKNGHQLQRYKDMWGSIRKTLKGSALEYMEGLRDQMGYKQLFIEYGKVKEKEGKRLDGEYKGKLEEACRLKIISKETLRSFMKDPEYGMEKQDLEGKNRYMKGFDSQMQRYKALRIKINQLDKSKQSTLNKMYDDEKSGYTEINNKYKELTGQKEPEKKTEKKEQKDLLADVTDLTVKKGIISAQKLLKQQGREKQTNFLRVIHNITKGEQSNKFDEGGFQANLQEMRQEKQKKEEPRVTLSEPTVTKKEGKLFSFQDRFRKRRMAAQGQHDESLSLVPEHKEGEGNVLSFQDQLRQKRQVGQRRDSESIDRSGVEEEVKSVESDSRAHVFRDEGFIQAESKDENNETHRAVIANINKEKDLKHLNTEHKKKELKGKGEGGHDKVSFAIKTDDGRTVELNLQQIRAMERFIKADMRSPVDEEEKMAT